MTTARTLYHEIAEAFRDRKHKVRYPADDLNYAKGRNGLVASSGIFVQHWGSENTHIALMNINSKGDVSEAARLVLPVSAIPELSTILLGFYAGPLGKLALEQS